MWTLAACSSFRETLAPQSHPFEGTQGPSGLGSMPELPIAVWFFFWKNLYHSSVLSSDCLRCTLKMQAEGTAVKACLIWGFCAQGRKAQRDQCNKGSCLSDLARWEGVRQRGERLMNLENSRENQLTVAIRITSYSDVSDLSGLCAVTRLIKMPPLLKKRCHTAMWILNIRVTHYWCKNFAVKCVWKIKT